MGDRQLTHLSLGHDNKTMVPSSLMSPESVVIVGASADSRRLAGRPLVRMRQHGFPGEILLVNPRHDEIAGTPCYPSVAALPHPVDVALVIVPAQAVPGVIEECGDRGIPNAVILSSGFEDRDEGARLTGRLAAAAHAGGVRLVGPNCEGMWNIPGHLALTFGSAADRAELLAGGVSVLSQSGSLGGACMRELQDRGIGCRYFVSTGNETDLTTMDFLEFLIDEGGSSVVALFVEALADGHRLRAIGRKAAARGVRIVMLRAGQSELGKQATLSHTGRMSSAGAVYRDLLRQAGVVEVGTFADLVNATEVAALCPVLPALGEAGGRTGVGVLAMSGGSRALIADSCGERDVPMAEFTEATETRLRELLPEFGYARNPTDVTGQIVSDPEMFTAVAGTVMADPMTTALFVQYANGAERQVAAHAPVLADLQRHTGKPVVAGLLGTVVPEVAALLRDARIVHAGDPDDAVRCLSWLHGFARRPVGEVPHRPATSASGPLATDWQGRMDLLASAEIGVPRWVIVPAGADPAAHVDALRFPLVAKALPEAGEHKTDRGLVALDLRTAAQLDDAVGELRAKLADGAGVLVQEMCPGGLELLVAVRRDPDFGPLLAIGAGGVLTEWLADVRHVQLPATAGEIERALDRLRVRTLFEPHRGTPRRDLAAFVAAVHRLGEVYLADVPPGWEIEINPLLVFEESRGVAAVDVLFAPQTEARNDANDS